jgi:hypothetical protein
VVHIHTQSPFNGSAAAVDRLERFSQEEGYFPRSTALLHTMLYGEHDGLVLATALASLGKSQSHFLKPIRQVFLAIDSSKPHEICKDIRLKALIPTT